MAKFKVLIFIVCYNHENFIDSVLKRIPDHVWQNDRYESEILIIDDQSSDNTFFVAKEYAKRNNHSNITVLYNPKNLGYGGNQKIGYQYAIDKNFDLVVLLHGDGQYPPENLEDLISPLLNGECDVVLGSRMVDKKSALRGKMPIYKWFGNVALTFIQNMILGAKLAEFHTGYKSYSIAALKSIPFGYNSDYFDFDTDILIQLFDTGNRFKEVPIPTFYGEETSHVKVFKYGLMILNSSINSRLMKMGIFYHPKFDYARENTHYSLKSGYPSPHQFVINHVKPGTCVLDIGCGPGYMAEELSKKHVKTISIDHYINDTVRKYSLMTFQADVETFDFKLTSEVDTILLLDIIEHLRSPESLFKKLRNRYCKDFPEVIISTGNIAFLPIRLMLLLGQFNYGKRGILDLDHTRLFTYKSLRRMLINHGYEVILENGQPVPFPLALGERRLSYLLLRINQLLIKLSKELFSYQIFMIVRPNPTLRLLLDNAQSASASRVDCFNKLDDQEMNATAAVADCDFATDAKKSDVF
jgi:glycosyltransferase involved in cell wall biosynthesis